MDPLSLTPAILSGHLERITYYNEATLYTVAKLSVAGTRNRVTVVGKLPPVQPGEGLKLTGTWQAHPRYGQQFRIDTYELTLPASLDGIRAYLRSGMIRGIGPRMADRLVDAFGSETFEVIENKPNRLREIPGIGTVKAQVISRTWKDHRMLRNLMNFLQQAGVNSACAPAVFKVYGWDALEVIRAEPYRLISDVPGIGFPVADTIALKVGAAADDPRRIQAAVVHLVQQEADRGHMFVLLEKLLETGHRQYGIAPAALHDAIAALKQDGELVTEQADRSSGQCGFDRIYLKPLYDAEVTVARRLGAILTLPQPQADMDPQTLATEVERSLDIRPSTRQLYVIGQIMTHRVAVITGGPGTGKTTLVRAVLALLQSLGARVALAAPTGRAAKRLAEVTGQPAKTVHRLLEYLPTEDRFQKDHSDPLETDAVIVDEVSMIDTVLMHHLLEAIPVTARLILVGDAFQLPAIGPGNVLSDLINSRAIQTFELTEVFRQACQSPIVMNAHRIRQGSAPVFEPPADPDGLSEFYYIQAYRPENVAQQIVELCSRTIPEHFYVDPLADIQVLTPMHKGLTGTIHLNQLLQTALNPATQTQGSFGTSFRPGDKVMHLQNSYKKEVFNGDIGTVCDIDPEKELLRVDFGDRRVGYEKTELNQLTLAYAISIHKAQGSEYPVVVVPLLTHHFVMLQRNLLYTAVTRAQRLVILISNPKALSIALENDRPAHRMTALAGRLAGQSSGSDGCLFVPGAQA